MVNGAISVLALFMDNMFSSCCIAVYAIKKCHLRCIRRDITCMEVSFGGRQQRVRRPPNNVYDDRQQH